MKKSVLSAIGVVTILAGGAEGSLALAQSASPLENVQPGIYYNLTPELATALNLDLPSLQQSMNLKPNDNLIVRLQETGGLDLSIYENPTYGTFRSDGVHE